MLGAVKSNGNCEAMNSHHGKIILDNVAILLSLFTHFSFDLVLLDYVASYSYLFVTLTLNVFLLDLLDRSK